MKSMWRRLLWSCLVLGNLLLSDILHAQLIITDNFTGASSANNWLLPVAGDGTTNTACLTAGNNTNVGSPTVAGSPPACLLIQDTPGQGALRLTDALNNQHGGIISNFTFPTSQGIQVTFTTYTYGGTGADGITFFLADGSQQVTIGGTGGSLGYTCSNVNGGYNGVIGGYLGLGVDEYGNFLNPGDNTASGPGFYAGRIGLRGSGSISWAWLNSQYPSNYLSAATSAQQQSGVQATCKTGKLQQPTGITTNTTWSWASTSTPNACTSWLTSYSILNAYNSTDYPTTSGSGKNKVTMGNTDQQAGINATCSTGLVQKASYNTTTKSWSWTTASAKTPVSAICQANGLTYSWLNSQYPSNYPNTVTSSSDQTAAQNATCTTGYIQQGTATTTTSTSNLSWSSTTTSLPDYPAFTNGYTILPSSTPIGSSATTRANATPINYKLKITPDGYLSFWYSYNSGAYQQVLTNQNIIASNGALPANFRFGFTGSTGGSNNVHEISCFQATPASTSSGSAAISLPTGQYQTGAQIYIASYHADNWWGQVISDNLLYSSSTGSVTVATTANWDASCVLTGGTCTSTGSTTNATAQSPSASATGGRQILTWNGSSGVGLEWATTTSGTTLNSVQQAELGAGDNQGNNRLNYLRGDRSNEVTSSGTGLFRARTSVLGDVINSSPTWVGPPVAPYPTSSYSVQTAWTDQLYASQTPAENGSAAQTYGQFQSSFETRENLIFAGANDGMLHGFRTGSYDANGNYTTATYSNDGHEDIAYMPAWSLDLIHNSSNPGLDFSSTQYGHNYFLDATPGAGDLFYNNEWHTWLIGGLGYGGSAIYSLDITDPTKFSESNASGLVIGEWSFNASDPVWQYLGNSYGTPQIRRFHNGQWGAVFGNGWCLASDAANGNCTQTSTGHAGIYLMLVNSTTGSPSFYFLDTGVGSPASPDGIAYVTPADLDGDHITDYVYAGDLHGNVWRYDFTGSSLAAWQAATPFKLFSTPSGQAIATQVTVSSVTPATGGNPRLIVNFGTGIQTPGYLLNADTYAATSQDFYGVWDWNMTTWNAFNSTQYLALTAADGPGGALAKANLAAGSINAATGAISNNQVCWSGSSTCSSGNTQYGWYMDMGSTTSNSTTVYEQLIYNPIVKDGALIMDTYIPANNSVLTCTSNASQGYTYALDPSTGSGLPGFFSGNPQDTLGYRANLNATGSASVLSVAGQPYLITKDANSTVTPTLIHPGSAGNRINWVQLR